MLLYNTLPRGNLCDLITLMSVFQRAIKPADSLNISLTVS